MQEVIRGKREDGRLSLCCVHIYLGVQDQELVLRKPEGQRLGIKPGEGGSCQTDFRRGQMGRKPTREEMSMEPGVESRWEEASGILCKLQASSVS